jgi:hypothetical protein
MFSRIEEIHWAVSWPAVCVQLRVAIKIVVF